MSDRAQHVIDAIDGALADEEFPDAMRWSPEPAAVKGAPAPFDGQTVWQPPQSYEAFDDAVPWRLTDWSDPATADPVGDIRRAAELMRPRISGEQIRAQEVLRARGYLPDGVILDEPAFAPGLAVNAPLPHRARIRDPEAAVNALRAIRPVFPPADMREARAFARRWAAGSGATVAEVAARIPDWEVHRCSCGAGDCTGWAMRPPGFGFERPGPPGVPLREIAAAEQLEAALRPVVQATSEAIRLAIEGIGRFFTDFGQAVRDSLAKLEELQESRRDAGLRPDEPPTDPKARALWLVQHRNTGPARLPAGRQRRPRSLP